MQNISGQQSKLIKRLALKKYRKMERQFVVEGKKMLHELLNQSRIEIQKLYLSPDCIPDFEHRLATLPHQIVDPRDLKKHSSLATSPGVLAVCSIPDMPEIIENEGWTLVLSGVGDPGNLGTIIRSADWFGFTQVLCTEDTVDCYNAKSLQASMGSVFRCAPHYLSHQELASFLEGKEGVYKAEMIGENAMQIDYPKSGVLIMGSESHGVHSEFQNFGTSITIPRRGQAESLNVGVATSILAAQIFHT